MRPVVLCVIGTRPEAVKMAPVVLRLLRERARVEVRVLATGQHRGLLDQALADFGIRTNADLDLMRPGQDLAGLTARALEGLSAYLSAERPDLILAQGDTTTVFATALASHYRQIPFGHVEAGLRTGRAFDPFPEEKNRVLATHLADLHFAPTLLARRNLLREGISERDIHLTGNTVIDALKWTAERECPLPLTPATERFVLVTVHRRESFGPPLERVCEALRSLVERNGSISIVWPVHPNPSVREAVARCLKAHERIRLTEPLAYPPFVALMKASALILTDSGGIQEEAPSLGKDVLVLRATTERPEALEAGTIRLVGTDPGTIVAKTEELLAGVGQKPQSRWVTANPYGDGWASERIARVVLARFGFEAGAVPAGFPAAWPSLG